MRGVIACARRGVDAKLVAPLCARATALPASRKAGLRFASAAGIRVRHSPDDEEQTYFVDELAGGKIVSPWHDVPLYAGDGNFNFVAEIPRGAYPKMEIDTATAFNPVVQDTNKDGSKRFYGLASLVNYGALPQTYEDPDHKDELTGIEGDGDPLDVCEIGSGIAQTGGIYPVKIVGALAMIDGGETDWKLLAIRTDDPLAAVVDDVGDMSAVPRVVAELCKDITQWFAVYKVTEGKKRNSFAFDGKWLGKADALKVVASTHAQWKRLVDARPAAGASAGYGLKAALAAAQPKVWVPTDAAWRPRTGAQ